MGQKALGFALPPLPPGSLLCGDREQFESLYMGDQSRLLSEVNRKFLNTVCETLGIVTTITNDSEYQSTTGKNERLLELCLQSVRRVFVGTGGEGLPR